MCHTPRRWDAGFKRLVWSKRRPDAPDRPVERHAVRLRRLPGKIVKFQS